MKKIALTFCVSALLLAMSACGDGAGKGKFRIEGSTDTPNAKVMLLNSDGQVVDSATVDSEGNFQIKGRVQESWLGTLHFYDTTGQKELYFTDVIIEEGLISRKTSKGGAYSGTPLNDTIDGLWQDSLLDLYSSQVSKIFNGDADEELMAQFDSLFSELTKRLNELCWQYYHRHSADPVGVYAMEQIIRSSHFDFPTFDSIVRNASPIVATDKAVVDLHTHLRDLYLAEMATTVGQHYVDLQGVDGKLSDLIDGQLTLVDFWASWCAPCRAEIKQNLVRIYEKYHKKGLAVVGINVWEQGTREEREAALNKAVAELGITYPQLVDSTNNATTIYGIEGIPVIMLIGPDGTILERDLRGDDIEKAVLKYL